ncbi:MAG: methylmalonyl-CoA mutase family protein [Saprospiraceae bacterium]|nr:methylmalonyl-CoA mutase family protein [Saprospiraceae bacterium]MDW8484046.1 methylmalonyl-CoA mutase family protein [Saprospiraceae bacterium]
MSLPEDFFADFPPVSKAEWLERIAKDLKGKAVEDLYWQLSDELRIDPFAHPDDQPQPPLPLSEEVHHWSINEDVEQANPQAANQQALEALAFGAESISFTLLDLGQLSTLTENIYLDYIELNFSGQAVDAAPAAVLHNLGEEAQRRAIPTNRLRGALYYDPLARSRPVDWRYLSDLVAYAREAFPGYRVLSVNGGSTYVGPAQVVQELTRLLQRGNEYLRQGAERGIDPAALAAQMQFCLEVGKSYYVEIARLRAFCLLWLNILQAWRIPLEYPVLDVRFAPAAYTEELYTNMIRATTMAMSAVLGGARRLTVLPYDAGREHLAKSPQTFSRRIARNVQHLLKLESGFAELTDPVAGSYFLEKLTAQLATHAWKAFSQAEGSFSGM